MHAAILPQVQDSALALMTPPIGLAVKARLPTFEPHSPFSLLKLTVWSEADLVCSTQVILLINFIKNQEQKQGTIPAINWLVNSMHNNSNNLERHLKEPCCNPFH